MKMTMKWNANIEPDLIRQIERSLSKVTIPVEVNEMNVESLDDECRRILLRLDGHCRGSSGYVDCLDMAKQVDLADNCVSLAYDRLEQVGLVSLVNTFKEPKQACISRDGKIAADDLRKLPEKMRQRETVEAKQRRREIWSNLVDDHLIRRRFF